MARGRRPDPSRRKSCHQHSETLSVPNKTKAGGWKAGDLYGLYCHHVGHTKPCFDDITRGGLECSYCKAGFDQVYRAYMPLWDREYQLRHVLIGEDFFEAADRIPFRHPVTLSRDASKRAPLRVSDEPMMVRLLPDGPPWNQPVDMLAICLTLWKDDNLSRWMMLDKTPKQNRGALPADTGQGDGLKTEYKAAARRWAPPANNEPHAIGDVANEATKKAIEASQPSSNGKHKLK